MSNADVQHLYQLEKSFALKLDELLHNEGYLGKLLRLPDKDLMPLVNYLNDVGFPPVKSIQLIAVPLDPQPFHSHWCTIQKMSTRVAEDMWRSESSPHRLQRPWDPFVF